MTEWLVLDDTFNPDRYDGGQGIAQEQAAENKIYFGRVNGLSSVS